MTFIEMGVEPDDRFLKTARERAAEHRLAFAHEQGSMRLLLNLMNGEWDEKDFLVVPPGWKLAARVDEAIVVAEKVEE
jgi:hypothetical protein